MGKWRIWLFLRDDRYLGGRHDLDRNGRNASRATGLDDLWDDGSIKHSLDQVVECEGGWSDDRQRHSEG